MCQRFVASFRSLPLHHVAVFLVLAASASVVFFPTFSNGLMTAWDDQWQVVNAYTSGGWCADNLRRIFLYSFHGQYSPLNQCLYIFLYQLFGYEAVYYHAASLLFHILNGFLIYLLVCRVLAVASLLSRLCCSWTAFLVALLFCIHPVQVEALAWISASKIVLSTFFYLCSSYFFADYLEGKGRGRYVAALVLFVLSYGFKEQVVTLPLWLLLLSQCYGRNPFVLRTWKALFPFVVLALIMGLLFVLETKSAPLFTPARSDAYTYGWWQRLVFSAYALFEYVWKWLFPYKLLYKYYYPVSPDEPLPFWLLAYPLLLVICLVCFWRWLVYRPVRSGLLFFLIHIVLVLHIVPIGRLHIVADRYMYLAGTGLSFVVVYYLTLAYRHLNAGRRYLLAVAVVSAFCWLGSYSFELTGRWHDTERLNEQIRRSATGSVKELNDVSVDWETKNDMQVYFESAYGFLYPECTSAFFGSHSVKSVSFAGRMPNIRCRNVNGVWQG